MKFWDASAIVPLLVAETTTRSLQALARRDSDMLVWWGSQVECVSALARLERGALLDVKGAALGLRSAETACRRVARDRTERDRSRERAQVSSRSSVAGGRCAAACGGFPCGRTPSLVARGRHARRSSRRRGAEGRFRVDRRCGGLARHPSAAGRRVAVWIASPLRRGVAGWSKRRSCRSVEPAHVAAERGEKTG